MIEILLLYCVEDCGNVCGGVDDGVFEVVCDVCECDG